MWVVTILHDLTEAIEKARLYEQLKQASVELERKVQEATGGARRAERAAAPPAHRARAGVGAQVAVPRQHVARVQDAAQRDPGLHAHAAEQRHRPGDRSAAQEPVAHRLERAPSARPDQRHPRHHPHRGRADAAERDDVRRRRAVRRSAVRARADHQALEPGGHRPRCAARCRRSARTGRRSSRSS